MISATNFYRFRINIFLITFVFAITACRDSVHTSSHDGCRIDEVCSGLLTDSSGESFLLYVYNYSNRDVLIPKINGLSPLTYQFVVISDKNDADLEQIMSFTPLVSFLGETESIAPYGVAGVMVAKDVFVDRYALEPGCHKLIVVFSPSVKPPVSEWPVIRPVSSRICL